MVRSSLDWRIFLQGYQADPVWSTERLRAARAIQPNGCPHPRRFQGAQETVILRGQFNLASGFKSAFGLFLGELKLFVLTLGAFAVFVPPVETMVASKTRTRRTRPS